jgi:hypothetical protein
LTASSDDVAAPLTKPAHASTTCKLFVNCTLKRSPEPSNTDGLIELSSGIMRRRGVMVDVLRTVDHDIAPASGRT